MNIVFSKISKFFRYIRAYFPTRLPIGDTQFNAWAQDIIDLYGLPQNDTARFALCAMVLHLDSTRFRKPKRYFGLAGLKSLSNQTVHMVMQDIKTAAIAAAEAEQKANAAAKQAEATATTVADGPTQA